MRTALFAVLVLLVLAFAGCSGGKGKDKDDDHTDSDTHTSTGSGTGTGTRTNTGTGNQTPNLAPVLVYNFTDDDGTATNMTFVDGNITISAKGSYDPDGNVSAIAVSVKDQNNTRIGILYDSATNNFTDVKFNFPRAGPVNVSFGIIDDQGKPSSNQTNLWVNTKTIHVFTFRAFVASTSQTPATDCEGPSEHSGGGAAADTTFYQSVTFSTTNFTTYAVARVAGNDAELAICDDAGASISGASDVEVRTTAGTIFKRAEYELTVVNKTPPASAAGATIPVTLEVHYDPYPAA